MFTIKLLSKEILEIQHQSLIITLEWLMPVWPLITEECISLLDRITKQEWYVFVAIDDNSWEIIGSVKLQLEQKFQRGGAISANIEELVTRPWFQKQWIGSALMKHAIDFAKQEDVYKIVLDCWDLLVKFYEKFWFEQKEQCMKLYL